MSEHEMTIGFIGNPNCGKTTLFNAYTGANLKVTNWPGVTVEKVEGVMKDHDLTIHLVDLPGTYSLTSYTMEETVSRQFILSDEVDVIINVADRRIYVDFSFLVVHKVCTKAILLGERSVRIREVKGSNPSRSIKSKTPCLLTWSFLFIQDPEGFEQHGTAAGRAINSPVGC